MTKDEAKLFREFIRWFTDDPRRVRQWRDKAQAAWQSKVEPGTSPSWNAPSEEKAAVLTRQYLCSMVDQWEIAREKPGATPVPETVEAPVDV